MDMLFIAFIVMLFGLFASGFCLGVIWRDHDWNKWLDSLEEEEEM